MKTQELRKLIKTKINETKVHKEEWLLRAELLETYTPEQAFINLDYEGDMQELINDDYTIEQAYDSVLGNMFDTAHEL